MNNRLLWACATLGVIGAACGDNVELTSISFLSPVSTGVVCGPTDASPAAGFQSLVVLRIDPPVSGVPLTLKVTAAGSSSDIVMRTLGGTATATVTLADGVNELTATSDPDGRKPGSPTAATTVNIDATGPSLIFGDPDSLLGIDDNATPGGSFTTNVRVTTNEGTAITLSSEDPATNASLPVATKNPVLGEAIFPRVPLAEGNRRLKAVSQDACGNVTTTLFPLVVDLTPPPALTGGVFAQLRRNSGRLRWTPGNDGGTTAVVRYEVRFSKNPITTDGEFAASTSLTPPTPGDPATRPFEELVHTPMRPEVVHHYGVVAFDAAGNRSALASFGPFKTSFVRSPFTAPAAANSGFGASVASGDINGDGFADLAIGSTEFFTTPTQGRGRVQIYLGSATRSAVGQVGLGAGPDYTILGTTDAGRFGVSVALVNIDGDAAGTKDIVVGAIRHPGTDAGSVRGRVYIFNGQGFPVPAVPTSVNDTTAELTLIAEPDLDGDGTAEVGARFGIGVADAGDLDGDTVSDLAIGTLLIDPVTFTNRGAMFVLYGGTLPAGPTANFPSDLLTGGNLQRRGQLVTFPGQVSGEGYGGTLLAVPRVGGVATRTSLLVGGTVTAGGSPTSVFLFDNLQRPVSAAGIADISTSSAAAVLTVTQEQAGSAFGQGMGLVRDLTGNGTPEILLAAPRFNSVAAGAGRVYVIDSAATGVASAGGAISPVVVTGGAAGDVLGNSLSRSFGRTPAPDDVDGDGKADLVLIGGRKLLIWYGTVVPTPLLGSMLSTTADAIVDVGGASMLSIGDVDGDGLADFAISDETTNSFAGFAELVK
jgi:hypothetical protein